MNIPEQNVASHAQANSVLIKLAAGIEECEIPFLVTSVGLIIMLLWAGAYKMTAPGPKALFPWFLIVH